MGLGLLRNCRVTANFLSVRDRPCVGTSYPDGDLLATRPLGPVDPREQREVSSDHW